MKQDQYSRIDSIKVKARANYQCQKCGSDYAIQAHAPNRDHSDWRKGIALCASCHADQHPNVPRGAFMSKVHQPYWLNISARELGRRYGCHSRTIIRISKKLGIPSRVELSDSDIERINDSIGNYTKSHEKIVRPNCLICNSKDVVGYGVHITMQYGKSARYRCNACGATFNGERQPVLVQENIAEVIYCPKCNKTHIIKHGTKSQRGIEQQRYKCQECGVTFYKDK